MYYTCSFLLVGRVYMYYTCSFLLVGRVYVYYTCSFLLVGRVYVYYTCNFLLVGSSVPATAFPLCECVCMSVCVCEFVHAGERETTTPGICTLPMIFSGYI